MTNSKFIYRVAAGISVLACCVSCVVTDETLGSNLIPIEQTYKFYTERIPIDQIEVRMADSLSGYSSSRLVIGAVSDEDYGMTPHHVFGTGHMQVKRLTLLNCHARPGVGVDCIRSRWVGVVKISGASRSVG